MKLLRTTLILLGLVPIGIGLYGLWDFYPTERLVSIGKWLTIGVVLHDGVLVPLTLLVGALVWRVTRGLPAAVGRILAGGLVVAGVVSLLAAPVIRRETAATNPTLLPQQYGYNLVWLLLGIGLATAILATLAWLHGRRTYPRSTDELDRNANFEPENSKTVEFVDDNARSETS